MMFGTQNLEQRCKMVSFKEFLRSYLLFFHFLWFFGRFSVKFLKFPRNVALSIPITPPTSPVVFLKLSVQERGKAVFDANGCGLCLSNTHVGSKCPFEGQWKNCDVSNCNKPHNRLVHGCGLQELCCATSDIWCAQQCYSSVDPSYCNSNWDDTNLLGRQ